MKSDRKMTEDILERINCAEQQKKYHKAVAAKALGGIFAFALVVFTSFSFFNTENLPVTDKSDAEIESDSVKAIKDSYSLIVANAAEDRTEICKESSVSIPLGGLLYVKDTKKMTEGEINRIAYEAKSKLKEIYGEGEKWSVNGIEGDTAVYFATADYLMLNIFDAEAVNSITLSCGESGDLLIYDMAVVGNSKKFIKTVKNGKEITVTGEEYKNIYGKTDGMIIKWTPSEELHKAFCEDPEAPLSGVRDEISGVIRYIDGTQESFSINLSFDDSGMLTATYSCNY